MAQKKYYIVVKGKKPGIYRQWSGQNGAAEQVQGFPKAVYKGFATRDEAIHWLEEHGYKQLIKLLENPEQFAADDPHRDIDQDTVVIYTDGAAIDNPGPGGYGVILMYKNAKKELSGGFRLTTNNRMELLACIEGLKALKHPCKVVLHSDSKYVIDGIEKGWAKKWQKRGWMRTDDKTAKNADLWEQLVELSTMHNVDFRWVKGHAGNIFNERCDTLATQSAKQSDLTPDHVYEAQLTPLKRARFLRKQSDKKASKRKKQYRDNTLQSKSKSKSKSESSNKQDN